MFRSVSQLVDPKDKKKFEQLVAIIKGGEGGISLDTMSKDIQENPGLLWMADSHGKTALHEGILCGCAADKIGTLLSNDNRIAEQTFNGRLPLHLALENNPKEDVVERLIEAHRRALQVPDPSDGRLPLHMVLEHQPFPASFVFLGMKVLRSYKNAARFKSHDRLPIMTCLEFGLQPQLTLEILKAFRPAAAVPRKDGKLPLHVAVDQNVEARIITGLMEAHPAALIEKMPTPGLHQLVLEYAIRHGRPQPVVHSLMNGDDNSNAKCVAYARAAATGRMTKDHVEAVLGASGDESGFDMTIDRQVLSMRRRRIKLVVQTPQGDEITLDISTHQRVENLRRMIQERDGTPPQMQRLTLDGKQLFDGYELMDYGIHKEVTIRLMPRIEILQLALKNKAGPHIIMHLLKLRPEAAQEDDQYGILPLHLAIEHNASDDVIEMLIAGHPPAVSIPVNGGATGEYPLHLALEKKYCAGVIRQLLKDVSSKDWTASGRYCPHAGDKLEVPCSRKLPLHMAIMQGSIDSIDALLATRCPISARDSTTGRSALECVLAAPGSSDELFKRVLDATLVVQSDIFTASGPNGQRPLHVACASNASASIIDMLCVRGPEVLEMFDIDGRLPIHLAVAKGASFSVVRTLLYYNPKCIHVRDGRGRSPLQLAVSHEAPAGVVFEITRTDRQTLAVKDSRGMSLIELAVAADAPSWVIQELLEASPSQVENLDLLSGRWPNTKASAEALRFAFQDKGRDSKRSSFRAKSFKATDYQSFQQLANPKAVSDDPASVDATQKKSSEDDEKPQEEESFLAWTYNHTIGLFTG